MSWTDERTEILKQRWADGSSASAIAKELGGVSRNGVIGKVHRMGLAGPSPTTSIKTAKAKRKKSSAFLQALGCPAIVSNTRPSLPPPRKETTPVDQRVTILNLTMDTCRWPIEPTESWGLYYCGGKPSARRWGPYKTACPYCDQHADRAMSKRAG